MTQAKTSEEITDEEKDKIRIEYYKLGGINMDSYADWLMDATAKLISGRKNKELKDNLKEAEKRMCLNKIFCKTTKKGSYWVCRNCQILNECFGVGK